MTISKDELEAIKRREESGMVCINVRALVAEVERLLEIERLWEQACDDAQDRDWCDT